MYFKTSLIALFFAVGIANGVPSLQVRQSVNNPCSNDFDCNPDSLSNQTIPSRYVECTNNGQCTCDECFMWNSTINRCYLMPPCTNYDDTSFTCIDNRRKQLTAFLLAFFLTPVGAANFYINRLEFAIPQLILGILFCALSCVGCCARQAVKDSENDGAKLCVGCFISLPTCCLSLMFLAWWIADLVYFGTNRRLAGDDCPLINNL